MKVYSDTLTRDDLYAALPADVMIADMRELKNPRKRTHGYEIHLEGYGTRHTRRRNSGWYGATEADPVGHYGYAATWDDHGEWMAALYEIDPLAIIACYLNRDDFYEKTANEMEWRQQAKGSRKTATAPWLERVPA